MLLAHAAIGRRDPRQAAAFYEEALTHQRAVDDRFWLAHTLSSLGYACLAFGDRERSAATLRESLTINWRMGNKTQAAWCLFFLALWAAASGYPERAARLFGAETTLRNEVGAFIPPVERQEHEQAIADLRARLGTEAFDIAFAAGETLPQEEAVAEALTVAQMPAVVATVRPAIAPHPFGLSERELDVVRLLVEGQTDRQIGETLFISFRTAQKHVANILAKLGVTSRTAVVTAAIRHGLVPSDQSFS